MLTKSPDRPQRALQFVDSRTGLLTEFGFNILDQIWRQVAAGYVTVPCTAAGTNVIVLTPRLHKEGSAAIADNMGFSFRAGATSTGDVTLGVGAQTPVKAYKDAGATQATTGDVVNGSFYVAYFVQALDAGAGAYVLK